jgi:hypothetical protein
MLNHGTHGSSRKEKKPPVLFRAIPCFPWFSGRLLAEYCRFHACSFGAPSVVLRWCFGGDRSSSGAAALDQRSNTQRNAVSGRVYRHKRLKSAPDLYAPYKLQAQIVPRRACELAIADFLNPPVVDDIDVSKYAGAPGQLILVQASDDTWRRPSTSVHPLLVGPLTLRCLPCISSAFGALWRIPNQRRYSQARR